jgi:hypothetical protein
MELDKVISTVKELMKYDERSVYFIILYLQISANRLQKSFIRVQEIEIRMNSCM